MLEQLQEEYPDDVRFVFRHFPLPSHSLALITAQAAEAAALQGMFWEMEQVIFTNQQLWSEMNEESFIAWAVGQAGELGLDVDQFESDLTSDEIVSLVAKAQEEAMGAQIPYTPFLLINGVPHELSSGYAGLQAVVELIRIQDRQFSECPEMTLDPAKQYRATLHTTQGDIVLQLFSEEAPLTVNSFIFLAEQGWFDNVAFHRVIPGFVAQAGDPTGTGMGGPGYIFDNETSSSLSYDQGGMVGMANSGPNTNGSQFFITYGPAENLNGNYTIFAEVVEGMDVAESLTARDPSQGGELPEPDMIESVTIEES